MFLFLLSVWIDGNEQSFYDHLRHNQDVPLVSLLHVDWCGHCKKTRPVFAEVTKRYKDSRDIDFMEINCTAETDFCKKLEINSFPAFVLAFHNQTKEIIIRRNTQGMEVDIVRLIKIKNKQYLKVGENDKTAHSKESVYPYFEFLTNPKDAEVRNNIDIALATINYLNFNRFKVSTDDKVFESKPRITAILDENFSVEFEYEPTAFNIADFIAQNSHELLGSWTLSSINRVGRRVAILVPKNKDDYKKYKYLAERYYNKFVWLDDSGTEKYNLVSRYFHLTKENLPAIVIMDNKATYYTVCKNIDNANKLAECQGRIDRDELPKTNFKIDFQSAHLRNGLSVLGKLFLKIFFGVLSVLLIILFVYIKIDERNQKKLD